ncbi:transposase, partial [Oceaniovalibus sp. ACAM 378]|uniref:integrase core domain-containing protein n=1 Tax=Oceaniovalibus sp. ACAM 378 TaxID=2599923 RepID=UPI002107226E
GLAQDRKDLGFAISGHLHSKSPRSSCRENSTFAAPYFWGGLPFNGKLRAECLNTHWFMGLEDTAKKLEAWRRDYNEERPHSAIGNKVPAALMKLPDASGPSV